jgi:hypothetical protein
VKPHTGLCAFLHGSPVEFLHFIRDLEGGAEWLVRPLFIADPVNRTAEIRTGARFKPLHTQFVR